MRGLGSFLKDAWRLARPYYNSEEKWSARGLLAVIIVLNLAMVGMSVVLNFWNRLIYNTLQDKDWDGFIALLFTWRKLPGGLVMPGFCEIAVVFILVAVYRTYLNQWLQIRWRRWMTTRLLDEWLQHRAYYRVSLASTGDGTGPDNPDQRISEDVRGFVTDTLSLGLDLLSNVVTLLSFLSILWTLSGSLPIFGLDIPGYMVWVALVYSIFGSWLAHLIGRPLVALNFFQQRVEANFRFALVRLRENVEGVALYGGEGEERRGLLDRFGGVMSNWWAIMQRMKGLNAFVAGFGQVASVFPLVVASPRFFAGVMDLGTLFQTVDAFGQVQGAMSWFVGAYAQLAGWRATVERLAGFHRAIMAAHAAAGEGGQRCGAVRRGVRPARRHPVAAGRHEAAGTSRPAAGARHLGGDPGPLRLRQVHPVPRARRHLAVRQRPCSPAHRQHAVPAATSLHPARHAAPRHRLSSGTRCLSGSRDAGRPGRCRPRQLAPRLDVEENWSQSLSGGEQQRVALARALLAKPDWLFLDEATASLDPTSEAQMYATLKQRLPGTTIVSIAHRPEIAALHQRRLTFAREIGAVGQLSEAAD